MNILGILKIFFLFAVFITFFSAVTVSAADDGTTELHVVKYASDKKTVLKETAVDYLWMKENLPVYGDGRTHYYMEGPVIEDEWESSHPDEEYDAWDPGEDVRGSITRKGDLGAVMGTNLGDLCDLVGGAAGGDMIAVTSRDGFRKTYPYRYVCDPDPRQGPMIVCWFNGDESSGGETQGVGYPDTCYSAGMRLVFFADNSTNPWGWNVFGAIDMKECWDEAYWNYGGQYPSAVGNSGKWVSEIGIYTQEMPPAPVADFEANVTSDRLPLHVGFSDNSTANPISWRWNFGDGGTSDEKNPVHVYTSPGTYAVSLTVTNMAGTDDVAKEDYITVERAIVPTAAFTFNATSGEAPFYVLFTDTSSGKPVSWEWDFGDGITSSEQNPGHVFEEPGDYQIVLSVENSKGSSTYSSTVTADVPVPAPPVVSFTADKITGDAPLTVSFTDTSLKSPTSWEWNFGDGTSSDEQNPVHEYSSPGVYTVSFTVENNLGSDTLTEPYYISATDNGLVVIFRGTVEPGAGTFSVTAPSGKTYTPNQLTPMGALDAVSKMHGFTYVIGDKKYADCRLLFLDGVNQYLLDKTAGLTWICYHNSELIDDYAHPSTESFNGRPVADGDTVVFYYGDFFNTLRGGKAIDPGDAIAVVDMTISTGGTAGEEEAASSGSRTEAFGAEVSPSPTAGSCFAGWF